MDIEFLSRRQAVTGWRDRQPFQAIIMLNTAGIEARVALDRQINDVTLFQSVWDPASFVNARIDNLMRAQVVLRIEAFLEQAAQELRALEPRFVLLADALAASASALEMPVAPEPAPAASPNVQGTAPSPDQRGEGKLSRVTKVVSDLAVARSARDWGAWASPIALVVTSIARISSVSASIPICTLRHWRR